ncbi:MAG: DUF2628 domain-containing protein [Bosea sp. (in: a-proteobacteria)]
MPFFMVMTPPPHGGTARDTVEQARIIKDGFSLAAFLLTGLWLLSQRMWLWFAIFAVVWGGFAVGGPWLGLHPTAIGGISLMTGLFLGHEGNALLMRKLESSGWKFEGMVEARNQEEAERRYCERALAALPAPLPLPPAAPAGQRYVAATARGPIIGLFPEAGTR